MLKNRLVVVDGVRDNILEMVFNLYNLVLYSLNMLVGFLDVKLRYFADRLFGEFKDIFASNLALEKFSVGVKALFNCVDS